MTIVDAIAKRVKAEPLYGRAKGIILGKSEIRAIGNNSQSRIAPDLSPDGSTYCGLPVVRSAAESEVALIIETPRFANSRPISSPVTRV
jgi:hypothetical protein